MNTTALVNASGSVVERYLYDPYGKVKVLNPDWSDDENGESDFGNEVLYAGYRFDSETGLYHVRRRYYHPTLGRWLSRDPAGYQDGMNLYEYCRSAPVGASDAMGIQAEPVSDENLSLDARIAYLQRQKEQWHEEYELAREQGNAEAAENFQYMIVHCGRLQLELKERRAGMEVGAFESARRNYLRGGGSEEGYLIDTIVRYWLSVAGIDANWETYLALEKMKVDKPLGAFLGVASGLAKLHGLEAAVETVTGKNVAALRQNIIYDRKEPTSLGYVDRGLRGVEAVLRLWIYFKIVKPRPMQETGEGWTAKGKQDSNAAQPPLKRIHSDETLSTGSNKYSLDHWRKQPTQKIVESLTPGKTESLKVKPDGRIMNGNVRIKVLEERGYDINSLPREPG
jgi:RHS repeat-associated protein